MIGKMMTAYNFSDIQIEVPENINTPNSLGAAIEMFRKYGVQNGYVSRDGVEFLKVVDGKIVESKS